MAGRDVRNAASNAGAATGHCDRFYPENLAEVLRMPAGYAVIRSLLERMHAFVPVADPDDLARRDFAEEFFQDIEGVSPDAALRLFADLRGFPCVTTINSQEG